ncbi:MAG: restriction endonuclease [Polaromonas sp.]|nr:restriction endonuclease [Polaromonas sp.]MDP3753659.1 restriction endonuclease [Polaromonas sp.]
MTRQYDFQNLSFDDFERLAGDLLSKELGVRLESFRSGRDGGVDLRYAPSSDSTLVVQCKRFSPDAFTRLLNVVRRDEMPKIVRLNPARYILVTSCELNPQNKDDLFSALAPYSRALGDIYGATELNALIRKHGEIEKKHFKLWMGSTEILEKVLHSGIYNYSHHETQRLKTELARYVVHEGFYRALQLLDTHHHCVILGMPGIGKTTAARLLLAHYLNEDFEVVSVSGDIEEAWSVVDRVEADKKLIVYYDDFLGQIGHAQKLGKNEDKRLLDLLEHCRESKTKRFILTTREYLFDQALDAHEPLSRASEEIRQSTVTLDDYTMLVRARLLINHLTFSKIPHSFIDQLVESETCNKLIRHQNFLPRLIEGICTDSFLEGKTPESFGVAAIQRLDDPASVWTHPFRHLTREAQLLLYTLVSLDGEHEKSSLEICYIALRNAICHGSVPRYFNDVLHEVEGSFTTSQRYSARAASTPMQPTWIIRFINPSAREFVLTDAICRPEILDSIFRASLHYRQALFWQEGRYTFQEQPVADVVRPYCSLWFGRGLQLIKSVSPELLSWQGTVDFQPSVSITRRLHELIDAASAIDALSEQDKVIAEYVGQDATKLVELFSSPNVYWLPEVVPALIKAMKSETVNWKQILTEVVSTAAPGPYGSDLQSLRYHWDAVQLLMYAIDVDEQDEERIKVAFQEKAEEAADEITEDLSADEIEDAEEQMAALGRSLNSDFVEKKALLSGLKQIATEREEKKQRDAKNEELADSYGPDEDDGVDEEDIESLNINALFKELSASLERL